MEKKLNLESGQAIILLALAIAGLLAFTALALDGAMVYSDRRTAQNGADAASNAGAGAAGANLRYRGVDREAWTCTDNGTPAYGYILEARTKAVTAATARAADNGYADGVGDNQVAASTVCSMGATDEEKYLDVQVEITTPSRPSLIHLFYKGPLVNTVTSISRVRPGGKSGFFEGSAIVGLKPDGCRVVWAPGNSETEIHGGGIFVNSNDEDCAFRQDGSGEVTVDPPSAINVVGGADYSPGRVDADVNEDQTSLQIPYPSGVPSIPVPDECDPSQPAMVNGERIEPGYWTGGTFPPNGVTELGDPGSDDTKIFCIDYNHVSAFQINGGTELTGHNVFIYVLDGGVRWNGGATIDLDPPDDGDYQGLLVYVDPHNYQSPPNETVVINGNSDSTIIGTVFAPAADCRLNGTGEVDGHRVQVICYTVEFSGGGELEIDYDADDNMVITSPPNMEVKE